VDDYHQCNRAPQPPDLSSLRDIRHQQQISSVGDSRPSRNTVTLSVPSQGNANTATATVPSQDPLADVPPGPLTGPPTKLRAYPHKFRTVIERAKQISQCECALAVLFPSRADFLDRKSGEHFTEAIADTLHVPQGKQTRMYEIHSPTISQDIGHITRMSSVYW
jgi:hypothetical protein